MVDKFAIHGYQSECARHRDNARRSLEYAAQRIAQALADWDRGPTPSVLADARHAASLAAEGYAEVQAFMALWDVRFLTGDSEEG